jgi:XTP/dITP diphosphohydrolase
MLTLVCASANPDKVVEIAAILGDEVRLEPRPAGVADVVEDADTLEGNARLKATAIARATGRPALADDTGLEVAALDGAPGVFAARFAGENATYADNRAKLLAALDGIADRRARFRTVAVVAWPDGSETVAEGICDGMIAEQERGARGFGYDPVFIPVEIDGRTFAEMSDEEKNAVSHRARALRNLLNRLAER